MGESTEVLVVGGGVCGIRIATQLRARGVPYVLAESRTTLGGRVRTEQRADPPAYADLGPAWVWPHQRRVMALLAEAGVSVFEQHTEGRLVFEGRERQEHAMATMGGSLRVQGGMVRLVEALAEDVELAALRLGAHLRRLERTEQGVRACFDDGRVLDARRVVLAMPPRVVVATIGFEPALPGALVEAMRRVPTWMAGHAKALAYYDAPFWRAAGLNGDGVSHRGPLGELHDASPHDGSAGVLFGFFAQPAVWRRAYRDRLEQHVTEQLARLYGAEAGRPRALTIIDWADEPTVATPADEALLREHPRYGPLPAPGDPWAGALWLSGTELSPEEGGYIEGALVAADTVVEIVVESRNPGVG